MLTAENKALKIKHKKMFDIVRSELNKVDPMGLEPDKSCPIDEYNPETEMVLAKIKDGMDYLELAKHIGAIFTEMFGRDFEESMFYDCAKNILEQISALQVNAPSPEKPKEKRDIKEFLRHAAVLFVGAALTVMSFCLYYLAAPLHVAVLVLLCIADFIYTIICSCGLLKYLSTKYWRCMGVVMAVAYVPVFIIGSALVLAISNSGSLFIKHIVEIVLSAFFTGPSIIFVILIVLLAIACIGYA